MGSHVEEGTGLRTVGQRAIGVDVQSMKTMVPTAHCR
jgi:hypothetical protein